MCFGEEKAREGEEVKEQEREEEEIARKRQCYCSPFHAFYTFHSSVFPNISSHHLLSNTLQNMSTPFSIFYVDKQKKKVVRNR